MRRIDDAEKKFGDMCASLAAYARGHGKMRDKGDEICRVLSTHAKKEQVACTMALCFQEVAHHFSVIQDHAESTLRRIEEKVIKPLSAYGDECILARERIKKAYASRKKELEHQMVLESSRRNMPVLERNILCDSDDVIEEIEAFEKKQLQDLKNVLNEFVSIELFYHVRAVENLSEAIKFVSSLNVDTDLELFRVFLRPLSSKKHLPDAATLTALSRQEEVQINRRSKTSESLDAEEEEEEEEEEKDDDSDYDDDDDDT